jgi:hypothetical protein
VSDGKVVRAMKDRIADMYRPPSNVTIAKPEEAPPKVRLESANKLIADDMRGEAAALRQWGTALLRAELAADWGRVASVREDIAEAAMKLEEHAHKLCPRAER